MSKEREIRRLEADLVEWADREELWEELVESRDHSLHVLEQQSKDAISALSSKLTVAEKTAEQERFYRTSAQDGLVANYEIAAQFAAELRELGHDSMAERMEALGLVRSIAYRPDQDPALRRFYANQLLRDLAKETLKLPYPEARAQTESRVRKTLAARHGWSVD